MSRRRSAAKGSIHRRTELDGSENSVESAVFRSDRLRGTRADAAGKAPGFFHLDVRPKRLSDLGDPLEAFGRAVDFEILRPDLVATPGYSTGTNRRQGRRRQIENGRRWKLHKLALGMAIESLPDGAGLGLRPKDALSDNDGHGFFGALGDAVVTGPTPTNVNDFRTVIVGASEDEA